MKYIKYSALFFIFLIIGCSNENPVPPGDASRGALQLRIDKTSAPSNVTTVEAVLTREGFDEMRGEMNLRDSASADILFNEIPVGKWNIEVAARDSSNSVIYEGKTDVEVLEAVTVQVNLTLYPTGNGKGSIYINVTWSDKPKGDWVDYEQNPILSPLYSGNEKHSLIEPFIYEDNDKYRMYYTGVNYSASTSVLLAESKDGKSWQRVKTVLSPGYGWDGLSAAAGPVIKVGDEYRMYYNGFSSQEGSRSIGLAVSRDGVNWVKRPEPVIQGTTGWESHIFAWSVIIKSNKFFMYYCGEQRQIGLATSTDGIHWEKYQGNPILLPTETWESNAVTMPTVVAENNQLKMVYATGKSKAFGQAVSNNGYDWKKSDFPVFTIDDIKWTREIAYPMLVRINNELRCYYTGQYTANGSLGEIGFAYIK